MCVATVLDIKALLLHASYRLLELDSRLLEVEA